MPAIRSHKLNVLILVLSIVVVFLPSLSNDFVGDDHIMIVANPYYTSLDNLNHLFSDQYIAKRKSADSKKTSYFDSGAVSYRPAATFFYFIDYQLWKLNPFGYHLSSLLFHVLNSVLVYFIITAIFSNMALALFCAFAFGLHPVKVEAICAISYRHDLISAFFILCSFLSYLNIKKSSPKIMLYGSFFVFYFLGVFAKESVMLYPFLILIYERLVKKAEQRVLGVWHYLGLAGIIIFHAYIYFVVFPNSTIGESKLLGGGVLTHGITIGWTMTMYLFSILVPVIVKVLPPLYAPVVEEVVGIKTLISIGVISTFVFYMICAFKKNVLVFFFLLWAIFLIAPASNIVPIANPMSHRFLYLPSLGIIVVLGVLISYLQVKARQKGLRTNIGMLIMVLYVGLCCVTSLKLSQHWKSDSHFGSQLVEVYPNHGMGYFILGMEHIVRKDCELANLFFRQAINKGHNDWRAYYHLNNCPNKN